MKHRWHLAFVAALAGCTGTARDKTRPPPAPTSDAVASAPPSVLPPPPSAVDVPEPSRGPLHAMFLSQGHMVRNTVVAGGTVWVATFEDLFALRADVSGVAGAGERIPFRGRLAATRDGARLFRFEDRDLVALDARGHDSALRIVLHDEIQSLDFSRSGGLVRVLTQTASRAQSFSVLRAADLHEIVSVAAIAPTPQLLQTTTNETYFVLGRSVYDAQTGQSVYDIEHLDSTALVLEDHDLFLMREGRIDRIPLDSGKVAETTVVPCASAGAEPHASHPQHRFIIHCPDKTIIAHVGERASLEELPGFVAELAAPDSLPETPVSVERRFSAGALARALTRARPSSYGDKPAPRSAKLEDGELVIRRDAGEARVRIAPRGTSYRPAVGFDPPFRSVEVLGQLDSRIVLTQGGADIGLLDAGTHSELEHYAFADSGMLHIRRDGRYETSGDATALEDFVVCTDGYHVEGAPNCKHQKP